MSTWSQCSREPRKHIDGRAARSFKRPGCSASSRGTRRRGSTICGMRTPTQLLSAGVHVQAVSEWLGHASTSFTMDTYAAFIPSMGRTAADAADQLFG